MMAAAFLPLLNKGDFVTKSEIFQNMWVKEKNFI